MHASAATKAVRRPTLAVEIVSDLAGLASLEREWHDLESRAVGATFFASYAWCATCWREQAAQPSSTRQPIIVVVRNGPTAIAIWPLAISSTGGVKLAQDLSDPFGQYADALVDPAADVNAALDAGWAKLASLRIDGLVLRKVRADAAIAPWLTKRAHTLGEPLQAPAVKLSSFADLANYRRTLSVKTRKNLRNLRNRLARKGKLTHAVVADANERARLIEQCFLDRADWLESGGLSSSAFADPSFTAIVRALANGEGGAPQVTVMHLALERTDGTSDTVSVHWGFEHRGRYYTYMCAKNPAYDAYSPGRLHLEDVITACAAQSISTVDFLPPAMAYKTSQATESIEVAAYGLPLTLRGRLAIQGWHGYLRPAIKKAVLATPASIRRLFLKTAVREAEGPLTA